jgi:hypothetical protein
MAIFYAALTERFPEPAFFYPRRCHWAKVYSPLAPLRFAVVSGHRGNKQAEGLIYSSPGQRPGEITIGGASPCKGNIISLLNMCKIFLSCTIVYLSISPPALKVKKQAGRIR